MRFCDQDALMKEKQQKQKAFGEQRALPGLLGEQHSYRYT